MRTRLRWFGFVFLALAVIAGTWWRAVRNGLEVEVATVRQGTFEETIVEDGRTRVRWHVDVTAPVSGSWTPAELAVGDTVRAGALLGTLTAAPADPTTARQATAELGVATSNLAAAQAAEAAAVAAEAEAQRSLGRAERLGQAGGVTDEELDRLRTLHEARQREREAAKARVTAAAFARDAARALLPGGGTTVQVSAPAPGVVLRRDEEHARVVAAGTPLLMIGSIGSLEVVVDVLSRDASRVPLGARLWFLAGDDTVWAHVLRVEPVAHTVRSALGVDEQRVSVVADVHAPGALGHDFEVRAHVIVGRRDGALVLPVGALVRDGDAWRAFTVDGEGRARATAVQVVARGADDAAVTGIAAGTRVVVYPPEGLADGDRVRARTAAAPRAPR